MQTLNAPTKIVRIMDGPNNRAVLRTVTLPAHYSDEQALRHAVTVMTDDFSWSSFWRMARPVMRVSQALLACVTAGHVSIEVTGAQPWRITTVTQP